jgi:hypothetical protein
MICGSLSPQHGASSVYGYRNGPQIWRVTGNILNTQSWTADKGWSYSLGTGRGATDSSLQTLQRYETFYKALELYWCRMYVDWIAVARDSRHLHMWWWTFGFYKMWGISWLAEERSASQEGICCIRVKVKFPLEQIPMTETGNRPMALLFLEPGC